MRFRSRDRGNPDIPFAPLVDIMFNLILFLTVTTTFASSGGIDVSLPQSKSHRPLEKADKLFVVIDKDGKAYIDGQRLADLELEAKFQNLARQKADTIIILQADRLTRHGRVVTIMDMAQAAGLNRLAIAVEQKSEPETPAPAPGSTAE